MVDLNFQVIFLFIQSLEGKFRELKFFFDLFQRADRRCTDLVNNDVYQLESFLSDVNRDVLYTIDTSFQEKVQVLSGDDVFLSQGRKDVHYIRTTVGMFVVDSLKQSGYESLFGLFILFGLYIQNTSDNVEENIADCVSEKVAFVLV